MRVIAKSNDRLQRVKMRQGSESIQVMEFPILISPIDCSVRIRHEIYNGLLNGDIQSRISR